MPSTSNLESGENSMSVCFTAGFIKKTWSEVHDRLAMIKSKDHGQDTQFIFQDHGQVFGYRTYFHSKRFWVNA